MHLDACFSAPESWKRLSISDVCCRVTSGGTPSRRKPEFYEGGTIGWVKTKELNDSFIYDTEEEITEEAVASSSAKILPKDTVLLAMYGATVGMLGILGKEMACNQACCAILLKPEFDRDYVFYQLLAHRSQLQGLATGAAQQNLSGQQIKELVLPFPPIKWQREIGTFLRLLDDRIALLRESNTTLEAVAKSLFKSWFVDFDPVRARAEGRQPEGMDSATADLFPNSFEESDLGLVPKGWRVGQLGCELRIAYGKNLPTIRLLAAGYPVFGGNGQIGFFSEYMYESRQVLIACRGAASGKVNQSSPRAFVTNNSLVLEETRGLPFSYLKGFMSNSNLLPYVTGSAQPQVTIENLKVFKILVPSESVVTGFENVVGLIEDRIEHNNIQAKTITQLRDTLLPRLISGQLRLPEATEAVEEALA